VGGSAAAAVIPLLGRSHGLSGTVPAAVLSAPGPAVEPPASVLPRRLPSGLRYAISVTPNLEPGNAGWCSRVAFLLVKATEPLPGGGESCSPSIAGAPVLIAAGEPLTNVLNVLAVPRPHFQRELPDARSAPATKGQESAHIKALLSRLRQDMRRDVSLSWFITSERVWAVRIAGRTFVAAAGEDLAPGWHAVVVFTHGPPTPFVYLDRRGAPIAETTPPPTHSISVTSVDPRHLPPAPCALGRSNLPDVGGEWEVLANSEPSLGSRVEANALFSCARAWYAFPHSHAVYSAAILLNAQNPARRAAELPGLTPTAVTGDFQEGAATNAQITARRVANCWLLVQGPDPRLRERLLHGLSVSGSEIGR
jgi:hypothetical protein